MTGAAMSLTAAASGFVVFLLSVSVVQAQDGWGVTYTATDICAIKGSTVNIRCTYTYPSNVRVQETFWFTKGTNTDPVDLKTQSEYSGRVQYQCEDKTCTLTIRDLRETDSAQYKFRFITNQPGGKYSGSPGVTLTVTVLHVWYKNGQKTSQKRSFYFYYSGSFNSADSYSCAVATYEHLPSPSVCVKGQSCNRVTYTDRSICAVKGSSVDISCTYNSHDKDIQSKFWFSPERSGRWQSPSQPEDLSEDSQFAGRVQVLDPETGRSTLRITDLRETDSAQYHFTFKTPGFEWRSSLPGTTLTVTALQVQVTRIRRVHQSSTEAELKCHSSCSPAGHPSLVWFNNGQEVGQGPNPYRGLIYDGDNIYCAFKGHEKYHSASVYPPKLLSVSVSPSAEIVEGSSVTLTCSSDANPAANFTWYKKHGNPSLQPASKQFNFSSIQSSDSGEYYCTAENDLGRRTSGSIFIHVTYPPKLLSVSVSPSAEIVEGSSVTLTCSSDANPAANYTWYKENQESPKASGQTFTITDIRPEHSGKYYCEAQNTRGRHNTTSYLTVVADPLKLPVALTVTAVFLAFMLLPAWLWIRRRRSLDQQREAEGGPDNSAQVDQLHYASVQFTRNQEDNIYSNVSPAQHQADKQEGVIYSTVLSRAGSDPRTRRPAAVEDPSSLYSSVNKVVQAQDGWGVTYTATDICAIKGSTVNIRCTYTYPSNRTRSQPEDLSKDSQFAGRVQVLDPETGRSTLRITDLRETDSAQYHFTFKTPGFEWRSILPGTTLTVTALQVQVTRVTVLQSYTEAELKCLSSDSPAGGLTYVWFQNGQKVPDVESASYKGRFGPGDNISCALKEHEACPSPPVYGPKLLSVSVSPSAEIVEGSSVTLTCSSDANPAAKYTWYKKNGNPSLQPASKQFNFSSIQSSDSGEYYCTAENDLGRRTSGSIFIHVTYAPKLLSVSVSPSAEIVEGSSVTLTCSSDANPAAKYTWYKKHGNPSLQPASKQFNFSSIQSSDSGEYYCTAENDLGRRTSGSIFINVTYAPKLLSVSVSPSAEIVEGSSVTLTCSSDANPAAKFTWYKENQTLIHGPEGTYQFTSISSEDRGTYYCRSENQLGQSNSSSVSIDVQYAPKLLSVSVSPSAEIVEGSSVTLTCSSDANPAANYTWYKENEESPKASGQIFTITDIRPEHSGKYYCEAQNTRGRHNTTSHLTVVPGSGKLAAAGSVTAVFLAVIFLSAFILIRKKRLSKQPSRPGERPDNRAQPNVESEYDHPSAAVQRQAAEQQDELFYASISFSKNREEAVYSNIRPAQPDRHQKQEEEDEDCIEYSTVNAWTAGAAPRLEAVEDSTALYSTVSTNHRA
ncbi:B-cell receptor CD22-like [Mastacembelus armatus]|uniref:B-cell receptor CD22-like n=1 Tax=Mastacembelus armatus TaxID=205130 RepID=UPI000E458A33|nr:B-cell receptor CD22-like [Mastacembelus armatus]